MHRVVSIVIIVSLYVILTVIVSCQNYTPSLREGVCVILTMTHNPYPLSEIDTDTDNLEIRRALPIADGEEMAKEYFDSI